VLAETYGIFVYQEQVMQAAQIWAATRWAAPTCCAAPWARRSRGDGQAPRDLPRRRGQNGIARKADEVFDLMEKFAGYGFNKSHAAAYSLLAYHTAWIKVHCTAEFYAANMTIEADNTDKLKVLLNDAKLFGIELRAAGRQPRGLAACGASSRCQRPWCATAWAPSRARGRAPSRPSWRARGRGPGGRGGGPFRSLFDFCARVDRKR
jgi:DNA polymerase-3 subunit alpha